MANCGECAAGSWGQGVAGSNPVIPTRRTAGQRPFRTKSEAASLLPCSHWCSHGTYSHRPIAAESRWTAQRAPLATWPCTSPVTATKECPSSSKTVQWHVGREHVHSARYLLSIMKRPWSQPVSVYEASKARKAKRQQRRRRCLVSALPHMPLERQIPVRHEAPDPRFCRPSGGNGEVITSECLSVCRLTPLTPRALAAVLIARSAFLGSTAVPTLRSEDEARLNPDRGSLDPLDHLACLGRPQQHHRRRGEGHVRA